MLCFLPLAPLGVVAVLTAAAGLLAIGTWAADETERIYGKKDDGRIVIDEVVGQLITLAPLTVMGPAVQPRSAILLLAGFLVFRLFDIWKPGPARRAERTLPGGLGVMMDDVVAGVFAAVVLAGLAYVHSQAGA